MKQFAGGVMAFAIAMAAFAGAARAQEKVTFALNWFPVGDHAAYWVALDKGYYSQRGLDVSLENSKGSGDSIAKVDTGRADVGLADAAVVIAALARGARIKIVGMVFDTTPLNIFSSKEMPFTEPAQLVGHTIGAPPGDGQRQVWPAFARLTHLDVDAVTWVNIDPAAKIAALAGKRVDMVADYTTGLPLYEKVMGVGNVVMMPWSKFGFDLYSIAIIASDKTMQERGKVLRDFLAASYSGWHDVMADTKGSLAIFKRRVPEIDLSVIGPSLELALDLMRTQRYAQHGIGWIEPAKMCTSVDLVNTYMGLPKKVDCAQVYTDDFLTRIDVPAGFVK